MKKSANVLGHKWKIKYQKEVKDPDSGQEVAGLCDYIKRQILISTNYPEDMPQSFVDEQVRKTLLHEITHAAFFESNMRDMGGWSHDLEHTVIASLEQVFEKFFWD